MKLRLESSFQAFRRQKRHIKKEDWVQYKKKLGQSDVAIETLGDTT